MELKSVYDSVVNGEVQETADGVRAALDAGLSADQVLGDALIPAMSEVGRLFEAQEYYVPEMLISAKAMQAGLALLKPQLAQSNEQAGGRIVIGTVKGAPPTMILTWSRTPASFKASMVVFILSIVVVSMADMPTSCAPA